MVWRCQTGPSRDLRIAPPTEKKGFAKERTCIRSSDHSFSEHGVLDFSRAHMTVPDSAGGRLSHCPRLALISEYLILNLIPPPISPAQGPPPVHMGKLRLREGRACLRSQGITSLVAGQGLAPLPPREPLLEAGRPASPRGPSPTPS